MGDVRDMNPDSPPAIPFHHMYGIIKVTRIVRVDREYGSRSEVFARPQFLVRDRERNLFRFFQNHIRERDRKIILSNDRENIDARLLSRAKNFNDFAFGINVPVLPGFQPDNYLVIDLRRSRELPSLHSDVNIMNKSRFIRHNVIKILRTLKRPDDGLVRFNQNLDYSALSIGPTSTATLRRHTIPNNPRYYSIPMHRRTLVLCRDIKISKAVAGFVQKIAEPSRIDLQQAHHQVSLFRQDITILPDSSDLPAGLQIAQ